MSPKQVCDSCGFSQEMEIAPHNDKWVCPQPDCEGIMIPEESHTEMLIRNMSDSLFGDEGMSCDDCGAYLDPDQDECAECGKPNPLVEAGLI